MNYISQFLSLIEEELPSEAKLANKDTPAANNDCIKFTSTKN